jgi:uncharacterized protein
MPPASTRAFTENTVDPPVRGFLHVPENGNNDGLVLTHGAGSNAAAPLLVALAEAFAGAGFTVLRCELPYRQRRSFGPPGPGDAARDRAGLKNAVAAIMKKTVSGRVFLGGQSYGGRQASMLCAEEPELVAGLLLLSYPLHPPGKPQQLRTQHLTSLRTPTLVVQGAVDPFGSIGEIEQSLKLINAKTKLLTVERAGHDLGFKGKAKREGFPMQVLSEFEKFFNQVSCSAE